MFVQLKSSKIIQVMHIREKLERWARFRGNFVIVCAVVCWCCGCCCLFYFACVFGIVCMYSPPPQRDQIKQTDRPQMLTPTTKKKKSKPMGKYKVLQRDSVFFFFLPWPLMLTAHAIYISFPFLSLDFNVKSQTLKSFFTWFPLKLINCNHHLVMMSSSEIDQ